MEWESNIRDFQKLIENFSEYELVQWIASRLSEHAGVEKVVMEAQLGNIVLDVLVQESSGQKVALEIYKPTTVTTEVVDQLIAVQKWIRKVNPDIRFVPVLLGRISRSAAARLADSSFTFWDATVLWNVFRSSKTSLGTAGKDTESSSSEETGLDQKEPEHRAQGLKSTLKEIDPGQESWPQYQEYIRDAFKFLFSEHLTRMEYEHSDQAGVNRRDLILVNDASDGFWARVRQQYEAHYIVVDAKNHKNAIGKLPVVKMGHYLKGHGPGRFGILVTREGEGPTAEHVRREKWLESRKLILIFDDEEIKQMVDMKVEGSNPASVVQQKIDEFRLSL